MKTIHKTGIALVVLLISIVIMIILASVVIMTMSQNDTIGLASKVKFQSDLKNFQTELEMYKAGETTTKPRAFNSSKLQANETGVTYNGTLDTNKKIDTIIPSLQDSLDFEGKLEVINGELIFTGSDEAEQQWAKELGINVINEDTLNINIFAIGETSVLKGTEVTYTLRFSSNAAIVDVNLTNNLVVIDNTGNAVAMQPDISLGTLSGTNTDTIRNIDVTIKTDNLEYGQYKLKVKAGSIADENSVTNTSDVISLASFTVKQDTIIDTTPPNSPSMALNPNTWTNGNVTVTITYPDDAALKQYSNNGTNWNNYLSPLVINSNNTTVYAKCSDASGNQSTQSTITISNIDKAVPTVTFGTNGGTNLKIGSTTVTLSDTGGSNIDINSLQYVWDTQNISQPSSGWTSFTNGTTIAKSGVTGTYYLWIKGSDIEGNTVITKSNMFNIDNTVPTNPTLVATPTAWTNGNVTVTITYPGDAAVKQYSLDGTTWSNYTAAISVVTNNTTVYAKCSDAAGNTSAQATLLISNIDKTAPTVTAKDGGKTTSSVTVTASATDVGGSGLNASSYQYSKDNGATWTTSTSATSYKFNSLSTGTYECKVKVLDNAGNSSVSDAVAITTQALGSITFSANPSSWTNDYVIVTIAYPSEVVGQYSVNNGSTWITYSGMAITVTDNNETILAKGTDAGGNQTAQAVLTVSNIEKIAPTITFGTNGGDLFDTARTTITLSDTGGSNINASSLQYSWDTQNITQPASGWTSFTNGEEIVKYDSSGTYYLWVKGSDNAGNNVVDKSNGFTFDMTPPNAPVISAEPDSWTNGSVIVTVTYPSDAVDKYYSLDGMSYSSYTGPITISTNNTTVHAYCTDRNLLASDDTILTISNIDLIAPTVTYGTNGATNVKTASTTVILNDTGGSNINTSAMLYVWDTQNITEPTSGWTLFTNGANITKTGVTGTYYLWIKGYDNAGNITVTKSNSFVLDNTAPTNPTLSANPTGWTNGNVTVTITYPGDATVKQYSLDAATWNNYTAAVTVSTNNTTVYAKCSDAVGNISDQTTYTVSNIDKTAPTVTFGTNGLSTMQASVSTTVTVNDIGGSGINASTLQYVWDTQNTTTPSSGWTTFTNAASITKTNAYGTYYLWIKASDNAGNTFTTKSNSFFINSIESYENGSGNTVFSYYNVNNWCLTADVANIGSFSYWTGVLVNGNDTAKTSFNINIPNDGTQYYLGYYMFYQNNTQNDDEITISVNGTYYYPTYNLLSWTYNTVPLVAGNNVITYSALFTGPDINESGYLAIDDLQVKTTAPLTNPVISASPTAWTNGNVTVTVSYPSQATLKQYSYDGVTWNNYSSALSVTTNNTIVYAKCSDGTSTTQSTLTVSNIDKVSPTVSYGTNGASNVQTASTIVTVSDAVGSSLNTSTLQYVWDTQNTTTPSSGWTTFTNGSTLTKGNVDGTYYLWIKASDNAGNSVVSKSNAFTITTATTTYSSIAVGTIATSNSTINGKSPSSSNPIIPTGFKAIEDGTTWPRDYSKGLIIEDASGNQFVWVPVSSNVPYSKWCTIGTSYASTSDDTLPVGVSNEIDQINKYGGFYIARYEAGIENGSTLISKKGATVWNNISYADAKTKSQTMYITQNVKSGLVTGTQWDTLMQWLQNSGFNVATDSSTWGNYYVVDNISILPYPVEIRPNSIFGSVLMGSLPAGYGAIGKTGSNEKWKSNNIYDIAGNTWEMTNELYTTNTAYCIERGGSFNSVPPNNPAAYRSNTDKNTIAETRSFRVALYIQDNGTVTLTNPTLSASPNSWTTGTVSVTITYPSEATIKQYSLDGSTWNNYTSAITVGTNNTTVYAKCGDTFGNVSGQATLTVSNIDIVAPIVTYSQNGNGTNTYCSAYTPVSVNDNGGCGVNATTLQYAWSNKTSAPNNGWVAFTSGETIYISNVTGVYYLYIKATDNLGNSVVAKSKGFNLDPSAPEDPFGITYPPPKY